MLTCVGITRLALGAAGDLGIMEIPKGAFASERSRIMMNKPCMLRAGGLLLGVLLAWCALAPTEPYSGSLSLIGGGC